MKKLFAGALAISLGATSFAHAGGVAPVIVEDAPVIIEDSGSSFGGMNAGLVVGALLLIAVIAAIASDSDSSTSGDPEPEPPV